MTETIKPTYATSWDCPHCGSFYDSEQHPNAEEATVGGIRLPGDGPLIPHKWCPECKKCMGCSSDAEATEDVQLVNLADGIADLVMGLTKIEKHKMTKTEDTSKVSEEVQTDTVVSNDAELAVQLANRLAAHDVQFNRLIAGMLASRQLYAVCLYELERLVEETNFEKATRVEGLDALPVSKELTENQSLMLREILINAAAIQAQKSFNANDLFTGLLNTVFPWLRDLVTKHNEAQAKAVKNHYEAAEKERIETPVGISLPILGARQSDLIERKNSVLLVGEEKLIRFLLATRIRQTAENEKNNVRQILNLRAGSTVETDTAKICFLRQSIWQCCAATNDSFQRIYLSDVLSRLTNPVDLLVVDDLRMAMPDGYAFTSLTSVANEAQKKLKRWAARAGCLLVGCLPLKRQLKANELNLPEYEMLRIHNWLRGVASENVKIDDKDHYRIFVGQFEVCCVPVEEVDVFAAADETTSQPAIISDEPC